MNEAEKKLRKRRRLIKQSTDINRKHADMMKTESIPRHERLYICTRVSWLLIDTKVFTKGTMGNLRK